MKSFTSSGSQKKPGLQEVTLLPSMDQARNVFKDFAQQVIERY